MMLPRLLVACALFLPLCIVWRVEAKYPLSTPGVTPESRVGAGTIHPWRNDRNPPIRIMENGDVPRLITTVQSHRFVEGEGLYKLKGPGVDQEPKSLFEIDEIKGDIWLKQPLDRETHQSFGLTVFAVSGSTSGHKLERPIPLEIQVTDMNDNQPFFYKQVYFGYVQEFSAPGTFVTQVSATDDDQPGTMNSDLEYSIISQETRPANALNKSIFEIDKMSGSITVKEDGLDREVVNLFRLRLEVADLRGTGLSSRAAVFIRVTALKYNALAFSPTLYHMTVVENSRGDIGRVNVRDTDEPGSGKWKAKYSIADDPHGYFSIRTDAETSQGILSVVKPLDYETVKELKLAVCVRKIHPSSSEAPQGPVSAASVIVTVGVYKRPYFTEDTIKLFVPQNVLPGTSLKSNIAVDPDNLGMRFEITEDPENWLDINKDTGEIMARRSFNRSAVHVENQVYTAGVRLTGLRGPSSIATVQIILVANNFIPQLSPLSGSICKTGGNFSTGLVLTAAVADPAPQAEPFSFDVPEEMMNWTVTQVNDTHAVLQPGADLQSGVYRVTLMVSDSGTPPRHSPAQVNVTLCQCDSSRDCASTMVLDSSMGISVIVGIVISVLMLIVAAVSLVKLCPLMGSRGQYHIKAEIDDQEEDGDDKPQNAINISILCSPSNAAPAPADTVPAPNSMP